MSGGTTNTHEPALLLRRQTMVIIDLVESVRLLLTDEAGVVARWRAFLTRFQQTVDASGGGRVVKSLGDGLLLAFDEPIAAIEASFAAHRLICTFNEGIADSLALHLRIGVHASDVYVDEIDVYGSGVNLAARLTTLARPGETVISAAVRDSVADGWHADVEDLGDCFLKHLPAPVRAFRALPPQGAPLRAPAADGPIAVLAVVPFTAPDDSRHAHALGDAVAFALIESLIGLQGLRLISQLSTAPLRRSSDCAADCHRLLGASYVLTGHCHLQGEDLVLDYSLRAAPSGLTLLQRRVQAPAAAMFVPESPLAASIVATLARAIVVTEGARSRRAFIPTLPNVTLYLGGVALMHRMATSEFQRALELFEHLEHRLPRSSAPKSAQAKWYLMRVLQGWSADPHGDNQRALEFARRALDADSSDAFALATEGLLSAHFSADLVHAGRRCAEALERDPHDAQVWRMAAAVRCYAGQGDAASDMARHALELTPLDPTRFLFELVLGAARLAAADYKDALHWGRSALRRNALHLPTHRLLVIAAALAGRLDEARAAAERLLALAPQYSVSVFSATYPGRDQPHAKGYAQALRAAGIPA